MKLRFTPRATQDLAAIAGYVREHNPAAALRVRASILDSLKNLALFPAVGRSQKVVGGLSIQHPAREREHEDA